MLLIGPPVDALREWLERADIAKGPVFRAIDRWEAIEERTLTPQSINLIVKRRCAMAGLEPREFFGAWAEVGVSRRRRRARASRCPRRCSSRSIGRCNKPPAITMRQNDRWDGQRA